MGLKRMVPSFLRGDYAFILLFLIYNFTFYIATRILLSLAAPGTFHVTFFEEHVNFINDFLKFMLYASSSVLNMAGIKSFVTPGHINVINGASVKITLGCVGMDIILTWWAIVLAYPQTISKKIKYFLTGTIGFVLLNIFRICMLAYVWTKTAGTPFRKMDHHTIFNTLTYILLFIFLFRWLKNPILKNKPVASE